MANSNPYDVLNHQPVTPLRRSIANPLTDRVMAVVLSGTFIFAGLIYRYDLKEIGFYFWPSGVCVLFIIAIALVARPRRFDKFWKKLLFAFFVMLSIVISILAIHFVRFMICSGV